MKVYTKVTKQHYSSFHHLGFSLYIEVLQVSPTGSNFDFGFELHIQLHCWLHLPFDYLCNLARKCQKIKHPSALHVITQTVLLIPVWDPVLWFRRWAHHAAGGQNRLPWAETSQFCGDRELEGELQIEVDGVKGHSLKSVNTKREKEELCEVYPSVCVGETMGPQDTFFVTVSGCWW